MNKLTLCLAALLCLLPLGARGAEDYVRHDAMVAMDDGVLLDASLYLPASPEPSELPLVVRQHGGGSTKDNGFDVAHGLELVRTGNFALLMYSHRGHGNSGGTFDFFGQRTTKDFSLMLDWVEATFGSQVDTDNVGTNGYSQGGGESLLPAEHDPRVKAVAVGQTFSDLNEALNPGDCVKLSFSLGIFALAYKTALADTDDVTAVRWGSHLYTDTEDIVDPAVGMSATEEMRAHSPIGYLDDLKVPTLWAQAWEDQLFPGEHPEMILEPLRARGVPVHYMFTSGGHAANEDFPAEVTAREATMRDWFDEFLRGVDHGFASGARPLVDYWTRTAPGKPGTWEPHTAATYPVSSTVSTFVTANRDVLARGPGSPPTDAVIVNDGVSANLAADPMANEVDNQSRHNGGPATAAVSTQVPEGPNPVDTATFTSAALDSALTMVGAPVLDVAYDTTATQVAQINGKVWDIDASGARTLIARGCLSIPITAAVGHAALKLWPNAHTFPAGHRVQLTLSAVDEPTFKADVEPQVMRIAGARLDLPVV
jgi:putative CocE/NonD family hydrolase